MNCIRALSNLNSGHYIYQSSNLFCCASHSADNKKLKVIEIITEIREELINPNPMDGIDFIKATDNLRRIAARIEEKHYSGLKKIYLLFEWIINGLTGGKTIFAEIHDLASKLENKKLNPSPTAQSHQDIYEYLGNGTPVNMHPISFAAGQSGEVHAHNDNEELVVKVTYEDLTNEFLLGRRLNHPTITKTHSLHKSKQKSWMVMEKINGKRIPYPPNLEKLDHPTMLKLFEQVKSCCLYLFEQRVYWADLNEGNLFITDNEKNLKICDLGQWDSNDDIHNNGKRLLLGTMEIINWLLKSSSLRANNKKDAALENSFLYPNGFEPNKIPKQVLSTFEPEIYEDCFKTLFEQIDASDENEIKILLGAYVDAVIAKFATLEQ